MALGDENKKPNSSISFHIGIKKILKNWDVYMYGKAYITWAYMYNVCK